MTAGRWVEIESDIESSVQHFQLGAQLGESSEPQVSISGVPSEYLQKMAFMHAMQAGYTSLESAFGRILRLFNEERPLGDTWHLDLMNRLARPVGDRPAFISRDLLPAVDEARRFRHVAMHSYEMFDLRRAGDVIEAAKTLAAEMPPALKTFIGLVEGEDIAPRRPSKPR